MRRLRLAAFGAIAAVVGIATACAVDVDVANKQCPCGDDYVCDTARNLCVKPDQLPTDSGGGGFDAGFLDDGAPAPPCTDDKCPCTTNADCKDPARSQCSPEKICVECLSQPTDTCGGGNYCNDQHQCTLGCKQESDCQISPSVPHCNTISHVCVQCTQSSQCGDAGLVCSPSGVCVEGCDLSVGVDCANGKTCCDKFCLDTKTDRLNCGMCGMACSTTNGTPSCTDSKCTWSCASGYQHCGAGNTGCDTNVRIDNANCGSCGRVCANVEQNVTGPFCSSGNCNYATCNSGFGNCNLNSNDGCECACGAAPGDPCCPGGICWFAAGKCTTGQNKCQ